MARSRRFNVCTRAEVLLLLDLAREHEPHIRLSFKELPDTLQIFAEADSPELSEYLQFMLRQLREQQLAIEANFEKG